MILLLSPRKAELGIRMSKRAAPPQSGSQARRQSKQRRQLRQKVIFCFAIITTILAALFALKLMPYRSDLLALRQEQASLPELSPFDAKWLEINPDYVGWLKINGTDISYPVVRGVDNEKYLNMTFQGKENILGAIFMDYRCVGQALPHIIIYGHQLSDISNNKYMFGGLHDFLDARFLEQNPVIMFMENNLLSVFDIYSARKTDINDPAYHLDFSHPDSFADFLDRNGAPADATQIITLSTCYEGDDDERRVVVQGSLRHVVPGGMDVP